MSDAPNVLLRRPALVVGTWREVLLFEWRGAGGVEDLQALNAVHRSAAKSRADGKIVELAIASTSIVKPPSDEMRREIARRATDLSDTYIAGAMVVIGDGFGAAVVRGVLSGALLLKRSKFPYKSFSTLEEACTWLTPLMTKHGGPVETADLLATCSLFREEVRGA